MRLSAFAAAAALLLSASLAGCASAAKDARAVYDVASPAVRAYHDCTGGGRTDDDRKHEECLKQAVKAAADAL